MSNARTKLAILDALGGFGQALATSAAIHQAKTAAPQPKRKATKKTKDGCTPCAAKARARATKELVRVGKLA